jgi:release factor glutamine methyltransferase
MAKRLLDVLQASTAYLAERAVDDPRLVSELLISHVLRCRRLELYLRFDASLAEEQLQTLRGGVRRLGAGEPVQYVLGETEFMGHRFNVDRRALIPRPETEELVAQVLACEALWSKPAPAIADVGTGSGCIAISLALARPQAVYQAVDISADALALAGENAARHAPAASVRFVCADLLTDWVSQSLDGVVANLPYVRNSDWPALARHIREHEPQMALDGGQDGLDVIRRLVAQAPKALKPGGFLFLEIGHDQGRAVAELVSNCGFQDVRTERDLAGRDRMVRGRLPCNSAVASG